MEQIERVITVAEFKDQLASFPDDAELHFADGLTFHRLKTRGENIVQVEFNESVYRDKNGKWRIDA